MPFWFHPKRYVHSTANGRDLSRCDRRFYEARTPLTAALRDAVGCLAQRKRAASGCSQPQFSTVMTTSAKYNNNNSDFVFHFSSYGSGKLRIQSGQSGRGKDKSKLRFHFNRQSLFKPVGRTEKSINKILILPLCLFWQTYLNAFVLQPST